MSAYFTGPLRILLQRSIGIDNNQCRGVRSRIISHGAALIMLNIISMVSWFDVCFDDSEFPIDGYLVTIAVCAECEAVFERCARIFLDLRISAFLLHV